MCNCVFKYSVVINILCDVVADVPVADVTRDNNATDVRSCSVS